MMNAAKLRRLTLGSPSSLDLPDILRAPELPTYFFEWPPPEEFVFVFTFEFVFVPVEFGLIAGLAFRQPLVFVQPVLVPAPQPPEFVHEVLSLLRTIASW